MVNVTDNTTQLFESAWSAFTRAWQQSQTRRVVWLTVGGSVIRLLFVNDVIQSLFLPALAHLVIPAQAKADLDIAIWDSHSTGVPMVPPPWATDDYRARGEIRGVEADALIQVAYHPGSGILSLFHKTAQRALLWMATAEQCPSYEQAAPLRTLLHWWSAVRGQQLVHGAAIGTEDGAVLLTGKGGSGKSTTALGALSAGLFYLGDDYVLCSLAADPACVFSIFNSAKIDHHTRQLLALSTDHLINRGSFLAEAQNALAPEKGVLLVRNYRPELVRVSLPLRAVLVPQIMNRDETEVQPLKPAQAFVALAPTTVFQLPGAQREALAFLRRLVMQLPCYQLQLGHDLRQVPAVISALLSGAKQRMAAQSMEQGTQLR